MKPVEVTEETRVQIESDSDIVAARLRGRRLAIQLGFEPLVATLVATVISELARNILLHAQRGEIIIGPSQRDGHRGLSVVAQDRGPGIRDLSKALQDGHSTAGRLGLGLPGARRLMDEFEITSNHGQGTRVEVRKWLE